MEKKRLFGILAHMDREKVRKMADELKERHTITIIKEPEKALVMVKMREPVKASRFYLGEVMVTEAIVDLDGKKGMAVTMGDDFEKTMDMAIIDAACNANVFPGYDLLEQEEKQQMERKEKENALFKRTMVDFHSMDSEVTE